MKMSSKVHRFFLGGFAALLSAEMMSSATASTVEFSAQTNYLLSTTLTRLPAGDVVELGTFTSGFNFAANSTNYTTTNAAFTPYATATIGSGGATPGQFDALSGNLDTTTDAGKQLYVWIFNSATPSTASQWAIVTDTADGNWIGPATGTLNSTQLDTGDAGVFIPAGALGSRVVDATTFAGFNIELGAVPEPSTYIFAALTGCVAIAGQFRKRRRASLANRV